jgi:hypothetical protein
MSDDNTNGRVFIYNTTNQRIQLQLNEESLPSIDPASGQPYAPKFTTADRVDATSTPDNQFAQNDNTLRVKFPGKQRTYGPINIDPESYPIDVNLVLYIFSKYIVLAATNNNNVIFHLTTHSTGAELACLSSRSWMLFADTFRPVNSGVRWLLHPSASIMNVEVK